jgi:hypothetical protein
MDFLIDCWEDLLKVVWKAATKNHRQPNSSREHYEKLITRPISLKRVPEKPPINPHSTVHWPNLMKIYELILISPGKQLINLD